MTIREKVFPVIAALVLFQSGCGETPVRIAEGDLDLAVVDCEDNEGIPTWISEQKCKLYFHLDEVHLSFTAIGNRLKIEGSVGTCTNGNGIFEIHSHGVNIKVESKSDTSLTIATEAMDDCTIESDSYICKSYPEGNVDFGEKSCSLEPNFDKKNGILTIKTPQSTPTVEVSYQPGSWKVVKIH